METQFQMRLMAIRPAAQNTNFYDLSPLDDRALPCVEPGAHINIYLPGSMTRQYSLTSAQVENKIYTIGVKRDPTSRGGSAYIHDRLSVGDILTISRPRNNFPINTSVENSVFIAGGIGITPIHSMIEELERQNARWQLFYSCRTRSEAVFLDKFQNDARVVLSFDDENGGTFLDLARIIDKAAAGSHFYCCGPPPMLKAFETATALISPDQVHLEYFSAAKTAATEGGYRVVLARSGVEFDVAPGRTILEVLREHGLDVATSCEQGICGMCETAVLEGIPDHRDEVLTNDERIAGDRMMICCSGCKGSHLVLDI